VAADGLYDTQACHAAILQHGGPGLDSPPQEGAIEGPDQANGQMHPRTVILRQCQEHGNPRWKQASGYHRRSLTETATFRIKTLFGDKLNNHRFDTRATEADARIAAMNIMTRLGMPESYPVLC